MFKVQASSSASSSICLIKYFLLLPKNLLEDKPNLLLSRLRLQKIQEVCFRVFEIEWKDVTSSSWDRQRHLYCSAKIEVWDAVLFVRQTLESKEEGPSSFLLLRHHLLFFFHFRQTTKKKRSGRQNSRMYLSLPLFERRRDEDPLLILVSSFFSSCSFFSSFESRTPDTWKITLVIIIIMIVKRMLKFAVTVSTSAAWVSRKILPSSSSKSCQMH